ncbi:hypothetical protein ACH5RR_013251 [Cinchona calisaya]|uniref:Lactate/malate dehydrogenase N-terminal domain-containing protein n=1 Tax=Cinchona calisaya TaxID=153742 RepID=A0ABD2ZZH6_9GENT
MSGAIAISTYDDYLSLPPECTSHAHIRRDLPRRYQIIIPFLFALYKKVKVSVRKSGKKDKVVLLFEMGKYYSHSEVVMELEDSLYPLLREVSIRIDPYEVFQDVEWALPIGAKPQGPRMECINLMDINGQIFAE